MLYISVLWKLVKHMYKSTYSSTLMYVCVLYVLKLLNNYVRTYVCTMMRASSYYSLFIETMEKAENLGKSNNEDFLVLQKFKQLQL